MTHDVFISYSHKDKPIADALCANLESAGFRCWVAPRDISPGQDWPTAISAAIASSRVMVLVFSADSNQSKQVGNEISLAFDNNLIIIPFKIDNIPPEPGKQYYLARTHWLDAMNPPTQEQIDTLVGYVRSFLAEKTTTGTVPPAPEEKQPPAEVLQTVPESKPPLPGAGKAEPARPQKVTKSRNIWIWGILVGIVIIAGSIFAVRSFGADPAPTNTSVPSSTLTSTITSTSTPSRTPTPRPTRTNTPQPAWVTEFAQPILDAIAVRSPNFQDDFHDKSGGWQADDWCGSRMDYADGELVVTDCRLSDSHINYSDFVVEFDARYLLAPTTDSHWSFHFRTTEGPSYSLQIAYGGDVHISLDSAGDYDFPGAANPGIQSNHIMVIAKGSKIAIFINGEALFSTDVTLLRYGDLRFFSDDTVLAIDNFKIWNIYDLP
jgi:hypothetical protein